MGYGNRQGDRIVTDLDHAREILRDSKDVGWGDKIKHPEGQVIIACAVVCHEVGEVIDSLADLYRDLQERVNALEEELGKGRHS